MWFTEEGLNCCAAIGRITPDGQITEYPLPVRRSSPWDIVSGPDGNLWFAERLNETIGKITPLGAITEFPVPAETQYLAFGSDGNIWFTEGVGSHDIGRINPSGSGFIEFPTSGATIDIGLGPDGNIWFTEIVPGGNRIGRTDPSGNLTEWHHRGGRRLQPGGMGAAPDGWMWFGIGFRNVGAITP